MKSLRNAARFGIFAMLQFVALTAAAMIVYPGGRIGDPKTIGYSFLLNFFSDLGRETTFAHGSNALSHYLFTWALLTAGAATIAFYAFYPRLFAGHPVRRLAWFGSLAGVVSGYCYIIIALTPWDKYFWIHLFAVYVGFSSYLAAVICFLPALNQSRVLPRYAAVAYALFGVVLAVYLYILFFGPSAITGEGLLLQAAAQKVVVYSQIVCMLVQAVSCAKMSSSMSSGSSDST